MLNILFVIDSLDYSGPARQLTHLAAHLPADKTGVCVVTLGLEAPWCSELRSSGIRVEVLGWGRSIDFRPMLRLRRLHSEINPDVTHAWGLRSASALLMSGACKPGRLLVSAAIPWRGWNWVVGMMLRQVGRVVAVGEAEAREYRRLGVAADRLSVVAPGVPECQSLPAPATLPSLPPDARVNLCLGPALPHKGHREAAWTTDIVRMIHPNTHLVVAANGPGLDAVRALIRSNGIEENVHLIGGVQDVRPWLARCESVWVPSLREGGRYAVLEAMAASRPVIASHLPGLAELVVEGRTGYLVRPGNKMEMCLRTRLLLDHPDHGAELGAAGRQHLGRNFSMSQHVGAMMDILARTAG